MGEPINIKTKKIIPQRSNFQFEKNIVLESLEQNIIPHLNTWVKFQQLWTHKAIGTFKDLDKYIVLMYLLGKHWQNLSSKFQYLSMDEFYDTHKIEIDKINLIQISNDLIIPKETIRRKINELQNLNVLIRDGKSIKFNKQGIDFQKPTDTIELLSSFIEKNSKMLQGNTWFGEHLDKEQIRIFIKKYFTVVWLRYFKLQIPYLVRHRNIFRDFETWIVWGNIALNNQYFFHKYLEKNLIKDDIKINNFFLNLLEFNIDRGVNASSIADITNIPRATVIRKLKWLLKKEVIKKNKKLEYQMESKGKLNKRINENFILNQTIVAEFLTDIFDYMKNSNFKV